MRFAIQLAPIVAIALLAACAAQPPDAQVSDLDAQCDESRMAAIDQAARRQFMDLRWVNCPSATSHRRD